MSFCRLRAASQPPSDRRPSLAAFCALVDQVDYELNGVRVGVREDAVPEIENVAGGALCATQDVVHPACQSLTRGAQQ